MCISFGMPVEMRRAIEGRGDRTQWYEGIKRNNRLGKVKWGEGWDEKLDSK